MELQKETKLHGRWYDDACGTAFGLEVLGERWTMLVVRELMLGPRRFSGLRASLPGISAKVLTERLGTLEEAGVLTRRTLEEPAQVQVYELTEWGYAAEPVMQELGRWAAMSSGHDPMLPLSPVSLMLSLRTMFDRRKVEGLDFVIGFDIGGETFIATLGDGALPVVRGKAEAPTATIRAPNATVLAALFYAGVPVAELEREMGLVIEGDRAAAMRFADIFELPEKLA
ncbi:winged helix-turn-helix transcriptional regulator [Qipengyuania sp. 6B39]|uniref:winged helix-turn-helix transcriptional regulator n=1 Tax=Qipengyuania proteolytica TaxID=2867239 RepID=UPI001C89994A|nr:helix-turn-helix domain-containing protein [Qipengyuania proteolytica]MBX7495577.1 winged helix-turn-helix transcriptional regulator [Qipengyuania proteolytica]